MLIKNKKMRSTEHETLINEDTGFREIFHFNEYSKLELNEEINEFDPNNPKK